MRADETIKWLRAKSYQEFCKEPCEMAIEVLEKQIAKKVKDPQKSECIEDIEYAGEHTLYGNCPNCGGMITDLWCPSYCGDCGQKIEWK